MPKQAAIAGNLRESQSKAGGGSEHVVADRPEDRPVQSERQGSKGVGCSRRLPNENIAVGDVAVAQPL